MWLTAYYFKYECYDMQNNMIVWLKQNKIILDI